MARKPSRPLQKAFVFNFELVTVVKGTPQQVHDVIRQGIKDAWGGIFWPRVLFEYQSVSEYGRWADPPDFFYKISETKNKINFAVYVKRNAGGKHFVWSDFGTGEEGASGKSYVIKPKKYARRATKYGVQFTYVAQKARTLAFMVPHKPTTIPLGGIRPYQPRKPGGMAHQVGDPQEWVYPFEVIHPGIRPRHFSQRVILRTVYNQQLPGGFKDATETGWLDGFTKARQAGLIP